MIDFEPRPSQVLLLWKLAVNGGQSWLADISPTSLAKNSERDALRGNELIIEESRQWKSNGKRTVRRKHLTLSERGWAWLADHLDAPISQSRAAADVLQVLLRGLDKHMHQHNFVLADLISFEESASESSEITQHVGGSSSPRSASKEPEFDRAALIERVVDVYAKLADFRSNARVRLSQVRRELSDVPRSLVDEALLQMSRDGVIALGQLDNPLEISSEDEEAKLISSLGAPRHIMHMEIPAHACGTTVDRSE